MVEKDNKAVDGEGMVDAFDADSSELVTMDPSGTWWTIFGPIQESVEDAMAWLGSIYLHEGQICCRRWP